MRLTNYKEAFEYLGIKFTDTERNKLRLIEQEGYKESNICYAIWKSQDKLMQFKGDDRFWSIFANEIRKHAFKSNY